MNDIANMTTEEYKEYRKTLGIVDSKLPAVNFSEVELVPGKTVSEAAGAMTIEEIRRSARKVQ